MDIHSRARPTIAALLVFLNLNKILYLPQKDACILLLYINLSEII